MERDLSFDWAMFNGHAGQEAIDLRYLPYMFGLCFRAKFQGIYLQNMARNGTHVPPFWDPGIPIEFYQL